MNYSSFQNICQVFYFDDGSVQKRCKSNGELVLARGILEIGINISSRVINDNREELHSKETEMFRFYQEGSKGLWEDFNQEREREIIGLFPI